MGDPTPTSTPDPRIVASGAGIYVSMFGMFGALALMVAIGWICMKRDMKREQRAALRGESGGRQGDEEEGWINMSMRGSVQGGASSISNTVKSFFGMGRSSRGYSRLDVDDSAPEATKLIEFDEDDLKLT